jgi:1-deoxy-D-xylulose-5-phosphate synthase
VLVHCLTDKGHGYRPAELDEADNFHGVPIIDPVSGAPLATSPPSWTQVFADELVTIGRERDDVVAVTAAMLRPVGLHSFAAAFPERVFDVGIAEQHAVTSAAGMAMAGLHPVVCLYSTFLNRAFDQMLLDVGMHRCPVTFVLDRAGVTGEDGPSHNGMWDLSILGIVPGMRVAAPRDAARLRELLHEAVADDTGPTAVRFPKASVADADIAALDRIGGLDVLRRDDDADVLLVSVGALAPMVLDVAARLNAQGIGVSVVDPRWVLPVDDAMPALAAAHGLVAVIEDNGAVGAVGDAVARELRQRGIRVPVRSFALPQRFLEVGKRAEVLAAAGLTAQDVAREIVEAVARLDPTLVR